MIVGRTWLFFGVVAAVLSNALLLTAQVRQKPAGRSWNLSKPGVAAWLCGVVDRLARQDKIDWLKLDYNADVGEAFDAPPSGRSGTVLYDHLKNYTAWLLQIRRDYLESRNCLKPRLQTLVRMSICC